MMVVDLEQIVSLLQADRKVAFEPWEVPVLARTLERNPEFNLVVIDSDADDLIVGAIIASASVRIYVTHVVTRPGYLKCGVARMLISGIEDSARTIGVLRVILHVLSDNTARGFFSRVGYVELNDQCQVTFEKDL